jgi:transposase
MSGYSQEKSFAVVAETRRRWSDAEKQAILGDAAATSASAAARKHRVAPSLVFRWRKQWGTGKKKGETAPAFVPVALPAPLPAAPSSSVTSADRGVIEIELAGGCRIRVNGIVETEALKRVIAAVEGR